MRIISLFIFFLSSSVVEAREIYYLARSPRALLAGDAFTARADDSFTLFYNPAALARSPGLEVHLIDINLGATNVLDDMDRFEDVSDEPDEFVNQFLNYPIHLNAGIFPTFKFAGFGFTGFWNTTTNILVYNAINPVIDIDYRYDQGFIFGYAHTFGNKGTKSGNFFSVGSALKYVKRSGLSETFNVYGSTILNLITNDQLESFNDYITELGYSRGRAWGWDIGMEYVMSSGGVEMAFAASVLDIGGMHFTEFEGDSEVQDQEMSVNLGSTLRFNSTLFDFALSADLHPLNRDIDFGRKVHIGAEVGIPLLRGMLGYSAGYVSYGLGVKFWPFQIMAGFYSAEVGGEFQGFASDRIVAEIKLFDFAIDL